MSAWLKLLRISNLPTAWSNILMAFLLVHRDWQPTVLLLLLILASSCFYLGGMVLNDVYDYHLDLKERPQRPLPAGLIDRRLAGFTGFGLLATGIILATTSGCLSSSEPVIWIRCGVIASGLALTIWLYDGPLKRTPIAPALMGLCRCLNVCLGGGLFIGGSRDYFDRLTGLPWVLIWVAVSLGVLIAGVTLLGRHEAQTKQSRRSLVLAGLIIGAGVIGLATAFLCPQQPPVSDSLQQRFPLMVLLISVPIIRSVLMANISLNSKAVQQAVITTLSSLIFFDAAVCYLAMPGQIVYCLVVLGLMIVLMLLKRFSNMT